MSTSNREKQLSRRHFVSAVAAGVGTLALNRQVFARKPKTVFQATELNHLSLDMEQIGKSQEFYSGVFGLSPVEHGRGNDRFMHFEQGFINMRPSDRSGMNHFCLSIRDYSPSYTYSMLNLLETDPFYMGGRMTHCYDEDRFNVQIQEEQHGWGRIAPSELSNADKGVFKTLRLHHLTLQVKDVAKSVEFYKDVFGATPIDSSTDDRRGLLGIGQNAYLELVAGDESKLKHFCLAVSNFDGKEVPKQLAEWTSDASLKDGRLHLTDPQGIRIQVTTPDEKLS